MKKRTLAILIGLTLILGLCYAQSRMRVGGLRQSMGLIFKSPQTLLSNDLLEILAGEFRGILSDYFLLETGSFVGSTAKPGKADYDNIYRTLKQALVLDPYFQHTYLMAQGILPWKAKMVDRAIELLDTSRRHRPWDWRPGHYTGFDYYYFNNDFTHASEVLIDTAKIEGAPVLLAILGARFAVKGQRTEAALLMLKQMLKDEELPAPDRIEIEERFSALHGVLQLERAIERYRNKNKSYPRNLETLVKEKFLLSIPPNPYADNFYYDPPTGQVAFDQAESSADQ